jgi:hypothetical protein
MKNKLIFKAILSVFCVGLLFSACDDWTKTESIEIVSPTIDVQNPELYAKYLENLRAYKASDHKHVYVWFDNSTKPAVSRGQNMLALPDSVDFIALMHPNNLSDAEVSAMTELRETKAMKFIVSVDMTAYKAAYALLLENEMEVPVTQRFENFFLEQMIIDLALVNKYNYDGICVGYEGKSLAHMTQAEKDEHLFTENLFFETIKDWYQNNQDKHFAFTGSPQYLVDKSILADFHTILLNGKTASSENTFTFLLVETLVQDVPQDRFGMMVVAPNINDPEQKVGYMANGELLLTGLTNWAPAPHNGIEMSSVAVYNVSWDYYNVSMSYKYTRNLIASINPSVQ